MTTDAALVSGEGVRLALTPAGIGSRIVAVSIDAAIQLVALIALTVLDIQLAGDADSAALAAVLVVETVFVLAGYPIVMEWLTRGRTVGKLCLGLRVVRDDGGPIGFRQALTRGLAGLVLEKPGLLFPLSTVAGMLTVGLSSREKRIGDMMAGTVVLNERAAPQQLAALPPWVPPPLQPWVLALDLHGLDDRLALAVRQFVSRAHEMSPAAQYGLGEQLRERVLSVVSPQPPQWTPTPALLASVLAERRRRAMAAAAPAFAFRPPQFNPNAQLYPNAQPYPNAINYPAAAPRLEPAAVASDSPFVPPT